jgi:predicted DNA-binding ribbon-helix-helix protein
MHVKGYGAPETKTARELGDKSLRHTLPARPPIAGTFLVPNPRRIDVHGHWTSFRLEPEYWGWLGEIATKNGITLKDVIEAIAATRSHKRSLASEIRVAVAAYFHGNPYPIFHCPGHIVPMRNGDVSVGWPRRSRSMMVDLKHGSPSA